MNPHAQHTPGPWTLREWEKRESSPFHRQRLIAKTDNLSHVPVALALGFAKHDGETLTEQSEANARLIAAAPDLLAALELCASKLEMWPEGSNPEFFPSLKAARAAIAKAKGAQ